VVGLLSLKALSQFAYLFSVPFPIPVGVANHIEEIQREFLLGRVGDEFKFHLVSWSKICTPMSRFGDKNLILFN
jgi:hypothetical protein